jgi:hypothetical protein
LFDEDPVLFGLFVLLRVVVLGEDSATAASSRADSGAEPVASMPIMLV